MRIVGRPDRDVDDVKIKIAIMVVINECHTGDGPPRKISPRTSRTDLRICNILERAVVFIMQQKYHRPLTVPARSVQPSLS